MDGSGRYAEEWYSSLSHARQSTSSRMSSDQVAFPSKTNVHQIYADEDSEHTEHTEHSDDGEPELPEDLWFTVPEKLAGHAIGKGGQKKNMVMEKTKTYIKTKREEDGQTFFIVTGKRKDQYAAKLMIKQSVNIGLLKTRSLYATRFPVIDSSGGEFQLHLYKNGDDHRPNERRFRLALKDPQPTEDNVDYSLLEDQISSILSTNKEYQRLSTIWCHFGRVYIIDVKEEEETEIYSLKDLNDHLIPRNLLPRDATDIDVTKWRLRFSGGLQITADQDFYSKLEKWMSPRYEELPPYHRYEFTYLTPSCREIRVKVFIEVKADDANPNKTVYKNTESLQEVHNILKLSKSNPVFYLCESTPKNAVVDIFEPTGPLDVRLIAASNHASVPEDNELLREVDILFEFVSQNLKIHEDGTLELPQDNVPEDFDIHYSRMSERKTYSIFSDDGEQFEVTLCHESPRDIKKGEYDETKNMVDIHLHYHEWERTLRGDNWEPQQIVDKIPQFLKCARSLARTLVVEETTPPEILARGPRAREAYEIALKSGKTKNLRVPIMFIGQSRAGKTSLLRSLKGEMFNPEEDSTSGVKMERSLSKIKESDWIDQDPDEFNLLNQSTAKAMVENLKDRKNDNKGISMHRDDEEDMFSEDLNNSSNSASAGSLQEDGVVPKEPIDDSVGVKAKVSSILLEQSEQEKDYSKSVETQDEAALPEPITRLVSDLLQDTESSSDVEHMILSITLDFAGQPVYQATHPVFLSQRGIYVLVHSLRNDVYAQAAPIVKHGSSERKIDDNCPMTNMDHLEFWLSFVASNTTTPEPSSQRKQYFKGKNLPPVFLACTHGDKPFQHQNRKENATKILYHLKRTENPPGKHLMHDVYVIDNTVSGISGEENDRVKALRHDIYKAAHNLPQMHEDLPIRWLKFEDVLSNIVKTKETKYVSLEKAKNLAHQCQVDIESDEFNTLLNYFHDLKVIIYFEDTNMVVIDPQWLLDMFVKIITVKPISEWDRGFLKNWHILEDEGKLDRVFVEHLWSDVVGEQNTINSLLTVMERFSLLCRWQNADRSEVFLVPAMLANSDANRVNELISKQKWSPLVIRFTAYLPLGIFPRLLVAIVQMCNKEWPDLQLPKFFHNFCRFYDIDGRNGAFDLVVKSDTRTIMVGVINKNDISHAPDLTKDFCQTIFGFIKKTLHDMQTNFPWMRSMKFEFGIRCPICMESPNPCSYHEVSGCMRDTCTHFIPEKELPRCYNDPENDKTSIQEEGYSHWFPKATEDDEAAPCDALEALSVAEDTSCRELVECIGIVDIKSIDAGTAAITVSERLELDRSSTEDPPDDVVKKCRHFCQICIKMGRRDIVKEIRKVLPSGMTGPLCDGKTLIKDMDFETKEKLSRAFTVKDEWRTFAEKAGVSKDNIEFYEKRKANPVLVILIDHLGDKTVDELYDLIVDSGANAVADYL